MKCLTLTALQTQMWLTVSMPIQGVMPANINVVTHSNQNSFVAFGTACQGSYERGQEVSTSTSTTPTDRNESLALGSSGS